MDRRFDYVGFDFSVMERLRSHDPDLEEYRNGLLEGVRAGRITPDEAEERALDRGLDSLITPSWRGPSVLTFRTWSIEMAVAWLIWGSKRAVQRFYTPYRAQCSEWEVVTWGDCKGYQPRLLGEASLADVRAKASSSTTRLSFNAAVRNLWDRVQCGSLNCSVLTVKGDEFKNISAAEAETLKLVINDDGNAYLVDAFRNDIVRYHRITFPTSEIVALWVSDDADRPLELEEDNVADGAELPVEQENPIAENEAPQQLRQVAGATASRPRGRRAAFPWDSIIREEAIRLLEEHGDFDPTVDPAWRAARLIDNLLEFCQKTWRTEPSRGSMQKYVRQYHEEFKQLRAAN